MYAGTYAGFLRSVYVYYCPILADIGMAGEILVKHSNMQQFHENMISRCGFVV